MLPLSLETLSFSFFLTISIELERRLREMESRYQQSHECEVAMARNRNPSHSASNGIPFMSSFSISPRRQSIDRTDSEPGEVTDPSRSSTRPGAPLPGMPDSSKAVNNQSNGATPLRMSIIPESKDLVDEILWQSLPDPVNNTGAVLTCLEVRTPEVTQFE
jgi:hypothetical protein